MGKSKIVSIIIPIYNVELYIRECIDSLLHNINYDSVQIICVNDGSTDNSGAIINEYKDIYPNLQVITQANKGLSAARNAGLRIAKGEYVAFVDSDDYIDVQKLIEIVKQAKLKSSDIAVADYWEFEDSDSTKKTNQNISASKDMLYSGISYFERFYKPLRSVVWRNIYKRSFLINNNLWFHEGVCFEDVEFTPIAFSKANIVIYTGIPFYYYRKRNNSITTSRSSEKKIDDAIKVWKVLDEESKSIKNKSVASVFRELGFHSFLNQYSVFNHTLKNTSLSEAKTICSVNMRTLKYNFIALLFKVLPNNLFHNMLIRMR